MDFSNILGAIITIATAVLLVIVVIMGLYDAIFVEYEDWYDFDEVKGRAVNLKKNFPIEHEFTGWTCLVHVVDKKGKSRAYKTSTMLYKILEEGKEYNFFIRDNAIWKVIEVDTRLTFKAK